jgi:DNA-binding IclR family transcriptional regulator
LEGTSIGAAVADPSRVHIVEDGVEVGVTAIACAIPGIEPWVGVSIIGPGWRLRQGGLDVLGDLVFSAAHELAEAYAAALVPSAQFA